MSRESLLCDRPRNSEEPQVIFVCDWHPLLKLVSNVLRSHYHLLRNDANLSKVFSAPPKVAFRRAKTIRSYVVRNDIASKPPKVAGGTTQCGR